MSQNTLIGALSELEALLSQHPLLSDQLLPPADSDKLAAIAEAAEIPLPDSLKILYSWHDGARNSDDALPTMYLFPDDFHFMFTDWISQEWRFPVTWSRDAGHPGLPFAKHDTGMFLVNCPDGTVWRTSWDLMVPGWPDGTMRGLINGVCNVLRAEDDDYAVEISDSGLNWIELEQE
ncbi:SMI1/KNR4 family protein [Kribbella sp. NPDC054772]